MSDMDGEILKYLIILWAAVVAGVGGIAFLSELIGTARIKVTSPAVRRYKNAELIKTLCLGVLLGLLLIGAIFGAKYLGGMAS